MGHGTLEDIAVKEDAFAGDPDYGSIRMVIRPGMWVRLSRNLDKDRGFVNGALGQVQELLRCGPGLALIFTVRLTHGCMVVVHPIAHDDGRLFLPCVYGYAMTTRKAQGATLEGVVLDFDLWRPCSPGDGC